MIGKSAEDFCARCGRLRRQTAILIRYKDGFICDRCIEERNREVLKDLEGSDPVGTPQGKDKESAESGGSEVEGEEGEETEPSPISPLDFDKLDMLRKQQGDTPRIEDLSGEKFDPEAVTLIPRAIAEQFCIIPIRIEGKHLVVAFSDPNDEEALREVQYFTNLDINVVSADELDIEEAIEKYYE